MTHLFKISLFRHKRDNRALSVERTWKDLCGKFSKPVVRADKDGPLFSPASFDPPLRAKANARELSLLVLDLDHAAKLGTIKSGLSQLECAHIISSTHSHLRKTESNPNAEPRFRVVLPLAEPIPAARFLSLWNYVKNKTGLFVDESAKDESRIFYTPAIASTDSEYEYHIEEGPSLDWKGLLLSEVVSNRTVTRHRGYEPEVVTAAIGSIANGSRNQGLFKIGKRLAETNLSPSAIRAALLVENERLCEIPLPTEEVESIAVNACKYPIELTEDTDAHSQPIPLPENTVKTPDLDGRLLPAVWRPWLEDVSDRLQCPLDYAAVAALVSAASLIGNRIRIRPKRNDTWMVVPNLWGAIVGPPGVMKTPAVNEGLIFFRAIADQERHNFEQQLKDADFDKEFSEAKKAELIKEMKKAPPESRQDLKMRYESLAADEPTERRLWTADSTIEKLGVILNENPDGILILRDELTGWLKTLDRPGHEQDRAFYLEAWNGEGSFTFDRIGRGKTHIKNLTISLLGTIQPSMIEPYYRSAINGLGDDGLIQRFQMLVYPEVVKSYRYVDRPPKGRDAAQESFIRLYRSEAKELGSRFLTADAGGHAYLQFDDEAQEFFQSWLTELETDLRSGTLESSALESHVAKYRSFMPSLALVFHLLQRVNGEIDTDSITLQSAAQAAAWCTYLQKHAEKLYTLVSLSEFDCAREILKRIRSGEIASEFTARDIYVKHWKKLSKAEDVKRGLDILVDHRYLSTLQLDTGGRAKTIYTCREAVSPIH